MKQLRHVVHGPVCGRNLLDHLFDVHPRNSIGIVLVSGMTIGTFFTLLVIPSIYMLIAKDHAHARSLLEAEQHPIAVGAVDQ